MQASVPITAAMPQAAPVEASPRTAVSDRSKARFTEFLQRGLGESENIAAPVLSADEGIVESPEEEAPEEEIAAELLGGLMQNPCAQTGEAVSAGAPAEEAVAIEGLGEIQWAAAAEIPGSGTAAEVHVKMVQEKIAGMLEADLAALEEPAAEAPTPGAETEAIAADEPEGAPTVEEPQTGAYEPAAAISPLEDKAGADDAGSALTGGGSDKGSEEPARTDGTKNAPAIHGASPAQTAPNVIGDLRTETLIRSEAAERALMRFSQDLLEMRTGVSEIKITLEPESLGELTISVMKTDAGVSARISSPDRDVCSAVADKLPILLQSIEKNGLTMQDLEIIHTPAGFNNNAQQPGHSGRQGGRRGQSFRAVAAASRDEDSSFWSDFHQQGRAEDATVVYRV